MTRDLLELKQGIIYGPVNSRRLGASLGLNILPPNYKACPFNCAYCQYGFTTARGHRVDSDGRDMPTIAQIKQALIEALDEYPLVSYITFSGNGEATLHPDFLQIMGEIKNAARKYAPQAKLAILSNSALIYKEEVRQALMLLDARFMKLDVGDEYNFRRYNRPHKGIDFDATIEGLKQLDNIIIQSLFASGTGGNYIDSAIDSWIEKIGYIKPLECHIYSLDRPSADDRLHIVDKTGLLKIKEKTEGTLGVPVKVF